MTDGPVVFSSAVEGFARSFASRMSPELLSEAKALGVDFANILPAYPLEIWEALMQKVGDALYADIPPERRFRKMGQDFLQGYAETLIGKAVITTARVLGPRRTLERMARNFQTATNYIASEAQVLGDRHVSVTTWMYPQFLDAWRGRPTVMLDYRHGILDQVLAVLGVQSPQVEFAELDLQRQLARYEARWQ